MSMPYTLPEECSTFSRAAYNPIPGPKPISRTLWSGWMFKCFTVSFSKLAFPFPRIICKSETQWIKACTFQSKNDICHFCTVIMADTWLTLLGKFPTSDIALRQGSKTVEMATNNTKIGWNCDSDNSSSICETTGFETQTTREVQFQFSTSINSWQC